MAAAMACVLSGGAAADELVMRNKTPYTGIKIIDVQAGNIVYKLGSNHNRKPLADVASIKLADKGAEFNRAEQLAAAGKAAEAVGAYDKAGEALAAGDWQMRLVRYRRMAAANAAGKIARSAADWLALVEESKASPQVLAARPTNLGSRGSEEAAEAVKLLTARLEDMKAGDGRVAVGRLLVDLHLLQGNQAKADEVDKSLGAATTGAAGGTVAGADEPSIDGAAISTDVSAALKGPAGDVKGKRYASAIQTIQGNLDRYDESELPKALLLLGKAQFLSADSSGEKRAQTLRQAGLNFMRAHAASSGGAEAAEALYMAALACRALGDKTAARNALRELAGEYKGQWADKAKTALGGWANGAATGPAEE
jgi:TolA-binding protein